jgi:hypothetical protein
MIDIDYVKKLIEYKGVATKDFIVMNEAVNYLCMLEKIIVIAENDNGKSATKSFEYMQQIKEVLKPINDDIGFNYTKFLKEKSDKTKIGYKEN